MRRLQHLLGSLCVIAAALVVAAPASTQGQKQKRASQEPDHPFEIEAGSMEYEFRRQLYVARADANGRVVIRQKGRTLRANWVAYSRVTRRGVASGDVVIQDGVDAIRTPFIEFDIDTLEGVMFDAEIAAESKTMEMRGAEVTKTGERAYTFRDGTFTTCQCDDPGAIEPWQVTAVDADVDINGYATARNTTIEVFGVPVLWLPWMIYPLKTERQSGLLFPEYAFSGRNGTEVGLPIFWAASEQVNVTLTPRWLQKRGAKGDLKVEYVLGRKSSGKFFASGLYDDEDVVENSLRTPFNKERWSTSGEHDLFLPGGARFKANYGFVSDNSYPNDFSQPRRTRGLPFLDARASVTAAAGAAGVAGATVGAEYRDDLQSPDDTDRDDFVLQRLPTVQLQTLPAELPFANWLVPALDVRYAWFQQNKQPQNVYNNPALLVANNGRFFDTGIDGLPTLSGGAPVELGISGTGVGPDPNFDNAALFAGGTEGDGVFQEGELLAYDCHRIVFMPRIGAPLRIADTVEVYPEIGWHETVYQSRAQGTERRGILTGRVEASMRLRGEIAGALHLFEPKVGWAIVDAPRQNGDPLFVPGTAVPQTRLRDLELENVTRDSADRISDYHAVTIGFGNRFYRRGNEGAELLADFVVQALYDIENSRFGSLFVDGRAFPFEQVWTRFAVGVDTQRGKLDEALFEAGWNNDRGDGVRLGYRYLRAVPTLFEAFPSANQRFKRFDGVFSGVDQVDGGVRIMLTPGWAIGYRFAYSIERTLLLANRGYVEYISRCDCWGLAVEVGAARGRGIGFNLRYHLLGLGDDERRRARAKSTRRASLDAFGGV